MTNSAFILSRDVNRTSPANAFPYILVDLCELGLQVLQQPVEELWNTPLLLS